MKKSLVFSAGLMILILLLFCASAGAAPLTVEEIKARDGNITEEEKAEFLAVLDNREHGQDLALGPDYTLDGRRIRLSHLPLVVSNPDGSNPHRFLVPLENTYYEIGDDVILVREKDGNRFNGRPAAGTSITLDSGIHVDSGGNTLAEGSKVLLLEKDGGLHAFYAGAGTDSGTLVTGKNLFIMRCFSDVEFHTPNGGVDIPISFATLAFPDGSGYITAGEDGTLNVNIDVHDEWKWWGFIPYAYYLYLDDCSLGISLPNLTIHMERAAGWFSVEIPLVHIAEELGYGFVLDMSPTFSLEGAGYGDTVISASAREGFKVTILDLVNVVDVGWNHTDPTFDLVSTDMEGEAYYGFGWGPALTWGEIAGFGGFYKTGFVLNGAKVNNDFNPDDPTDADWHVCGNNNCFQGSAFTRQGPFSANIVLFDGMVSVPIIASDPWDGDPFVKFYMSKTFGDKSMDSFCPHWAYRLDVQVEDADGNVFQGANVYYKDVPEHYEEFSSAVTDENGHAVLCTKTGTIEVTAELANPDDPSHPITVTQTVEKTAAAQSVTLVLEAPAKHVYFKNPDTGEATVWPDDITFKPLISKDVTLPDTIPELSGRQFTGWNTAEDGSGTSYAPGTKLTLSEDLTLWAQWVIAEDRWFVIYDANGGTKAPGPQEIALGADAVLTAELPENGDLIFKGWTPDLQKMDPVYQPGDTLAYDSRKSYVVLHAVWDLSPVPQPIHISFKLNGLHEAVLPADIWCAQGSWLQLRPAEVPIGSIWTFVGWSEDPHAKTPEFPAGRSYYFYRSTVLYAIWSQADTVTLTFRDPLPDPASGIPEPITVLPSMSRDVEIPHMIPEKSGRVFTGWNTAEDGSGREFAPGSVITLTQDVTLWAQWKNTGDSWYIVFNANGGTKAPVAQEFPKGTDAVLTSELPENGSLVFRGWTQDPQNPDPVYQPGDTLPYDSGKNYVVLYAMWNLTPAGRPVVVTFHANGGLPETVPHSVSAPKAVWFQLPAAEPSWDPQHSFLGWARNPEASRAELKPGGAAVFNADTTLYAVWRAHYTVTSGAGSTWTKHSTDVQRFVADGNIMYFTEFRIDGKRFEDGVEITSGSTVADIKPWAMEKLANGLHTVTFVYEDGEASAKFTVKEVPKTGDTAHPALWLALLVFGIAGLALPGIRTRTANRKK